MEAVVVDFFEATAEQDFERACDLIDEGGAGRDAPGAARALGATDERLRCSAIMESVIGESFADVTVRVRQGTSISGNRARAEAALKPEGEPSTFRTILLEQDEDGSDWLISDFG